MNVLKLVVSASIIIWTILGLTSCGTTITTSNPVKINTSSESTDSNRSIKIDIDTGATGSVDSNKTDTQDVSLKDSIDWGNIIKFLDSYYNNKNYLSSVFAKSFTFNRLEWNAEGSNWVPDATHQELWFLKWAYFGSGILKAEQLNSIAATSIIDLAGGTNIINIIDIWTNPLDSVMDDNEFAKSNLTKLLVVSEKADLTVSGIFYQKLPDDNLCLSTSNEFKKETINTFVGLGNKGCFIVNKNSQLNLIN